MAETFIEKTRPEKYEPNNFFHKNKVTEFVDKIFPFSDVENLKKNHQKI